MAEFYYLQFAHRIVLYIASFGGKIFMDQK